MAKELAKARAEASPEQTRGATGREALEMPFEMSFAFSCYLVAGRQSWRRS